VEEDKEGVRRWEEEAKRNKDGLRIVKLEWQRAVKEN